MKIVFMGTPRFAACALEAILAHGDEVALVVTRADKPKGRGYTVTPSEVKKLALEKGIPVITPATLRDGEVVNTLREVGAELFIVAAYGRLLPQEVLDIPSLGCINIHASLLPSLRGAAPIERAIMRGDTVGGITVMYMDAGLDTGDIILQKKTDIPHSMNSGEYREKLSHIGAEAICEFLDLAKSGSIPREKQPESGPDYADKLDKSECKISFDRPCADVYNMIRGLAPSPCAFAVFGGRRIKLCSCREMSGSGETGTVIGFEKDGFEIACGRGSLLITSVQPEGKGVMPAADFLRGKPFQLGAKAE